MSSFRLLLLFPAIVAAALPGSTAPAPVRVRVTDSHSGIPLPCRLTIVDARGELTPLQIAPEPTLAVRRGIIYTATGDASFTVPAGRYTIFAARGPRYSLATQPVEVGGRAREVRLRLEREVETPGYVSCDPHIHTLTFSGHGDCTAEERLVTLAGEEIELPIAAEHNRLADYTPLARSTHTETYLTPVIGDEVTTTVGHFILFPLAPGTTPPDYHSTDRGTILAGMRRTPGARVSILNHPRDLHSDFRPADPSRFHPLSGESLDGQSWDADGIEVINSGAQQSDWMQPYRDWFALLNHGKRMIGVGASDSHDVNRYIVGQARTYLASTAIRPDRIDAREACDSFLAGKALVSSGLITEMAVDDRFHVGDLAAVAGSRMNVRVTVRGPRWLSADRVELYADGQLVGARALTPGPRAIVKGDVVFPLDRPKHDEWLVAIASGPGVTAPYWPLARPYQPTRADWEPRVIGSTSPVWVDGDGDGTYQSPHEYARRLVSASGNDTRTLLGALAEYDATVAVQAASLRRGRANDLLAPAARAAVDQSAPHVRQAIVAYGAYLAPRPD